MALLIGSIFAAAGILTAMFISEPYFNTTNFYFDIFTVLSLSGMYVFRNSLSLKSKTLLAIGFIYIIFLSSIVQYGTLSNQKNLITLIPFLLILVFDLRTAFLAFIGLLVSYFFVSYLFLTGKIEYNPQAPVNLTPMFWIISGIVTFATGIIIMFLANNYNKEIGKSLNELEATTAKLKLRDRQHLDHIEEKNIMIQEIHHRVKNNLAVVSGLLELQMRHIEDARLEMAMQKSINRVISIAKVHEMLYLSEDFNKIPLKEYIHDLAHIVMSTMNCYHLDLKFSSTVEVNHLDVSHGVPVGIIINELITNSIKYGFTDVSGDKKISIKITQNGELAEVMYSDNGIGIEDFEEASTKSLGFSLVQSLLTQLDASYQYNTANKFELRFSFKH